MRGEGVLFSQRLVVAIVVVIVVTGLSQVVSDTAVVRAMIWRRL
jgi:hypothetical protein